MGEAATDVSWRTKLIVLLAFSVFQMLGYQLIGMMPHTNPLDATTRFDLLIPFLPFFVIFYTIGNLYYLLPFLVVKNRTLYTRMTIGFFAITAISFICFVAFPVEMKKDIIYNTDIYSQIVQFVHHADTWFNNTPSLHVTLTIFAWLVLLAESRILAFATAPLALAIIASVLFIKQHLMIDVISGVLLATAIYLWTTHDAGKWGMAWLERMTQLLFKI